jgi:hypothetical protein
MQDKNIPGGFCRPGRIFDLIVFFVVLEFFSMSKGEGKNEKFLDFFRRS